MKRNHWTLAAGIAAAALLAGCASNQTKAEKLAMYQAHASEPVRQVPYFSPQGWEEVDRDHIIVTMRPSEAYLMRLNGPCLDYDNGAAAMLISSTAGVVQPKFDRVSFPGSQLQLPHRGNPPDRHARGARQQEHLTPAGFGRQASGGT